MGEMFVLPDRGRSGRGECRWDAAVVVVVGLSQITVMVVAEVVVVVGFIDGVLLRYLGCDRNKVKQDNE